MIPTLKLHELKCLYLLSLNAIANISGPKLKLSQIFLFFFLQKNTNKICKHCVAFFFLFQCFFYVTPFFGGGIARFPLNKFWKILEIESVQQSKRLLSIHFVSIFATIFSRLTVRYSIWSKGSSLSGSLQKERREKPITINRLFVHQI